MGQKRPVQVFLLVTEDTLEESLLGTLSAKHELALAALDPDAEVTEVDLSSGVDELKKRMEVLLGTKPEAPMDESLKEQVEKETEVLARKERIASAGGQLLGAAFSFMGEIFSGRGESEQTIQMAEMFKKQLSDCLEKGEDGRLKMTVTIPDETALDNMAKSLAKMVGSSYK